MRTKRRGWRWGIGFALIGMGAAVTPLLSRREPLLLSRAVSTGLTVKQHYYWLAGQELLILGRSGGSLSVHPMRYNTASRTTTELPLLKDVLNSVGADDRFLKVSPDGQRLLLPNSGLTFVVRIDGTDLHGWDVSLPQQGAAWDPGGRYWFTFIGPSLFSIDRPRQKCIQVLVHDTAGPYLTVHWQIGKVNRPVALHQVEDRLHYERDVSTRSWSLSAQSPLAAGDCNLRRASMPTQDRLLVPAAPPSSAPRWETPSAPADIYELNVRTGGMGTRRVTEFRALGGKVEEQVLSPRGDRQAWLVMNPNLPTGPTWLRRIWQRLGRRQSPQLEIWTSDLQGNERNEVGYLPVAPRMPVPVRLPTEILFPGSPFLKPAPGEIYDLRWLPDGKHLSFLYHDLLYTVPLD